MWSSGEFFVRSPRRRFTVVANALRAFRILKLLKVIPRIQRMRLITMAVTRVFQVRLSLPCMGLGHPAGDPLEESFPEVLVGRVTTGNGHFGFRRLLGLPGSQTPNKPAPLPGLHLTTDLLESQFDHLVKVNRDEQVPSTRTQRQESRVRYTTDPGRSGPACLVVLSAVPGVHRGTASRRRLRLRHRRRRVLPRRVQPRGRDGAQLSEQLQVRVWVSRYACFHVCQLLNFSNSFRLCVRVWIACENHHPKFSSTMTCTK